MDSNRTEELLNKYWNCETSLDEEQQLREYFQGNNIPEQLKDTGMLFHYFEVQKKKSLNDVSFDGRVMENLNKNKQVRTTKLIYNSMRIAAGVAVLLAASWFVHHEIRKTMPQETMVDTYDNPAMAFKETKKALMMIAAGFGKAEEQTKKINLFNEAQEKIQKKEKRKL